MTTHQIDYYLHITTTIIYTSEWILTTHQQSCGKVPVMPARPAKFGYDRRKWLHSRTAWPALFASEKSKNKVPPRKPASFSLISFPNVSLLYRCVIWKWPRSYDWLRESRLVSLSFFTCPTYRKNEVQLQKTVKTERQVSIIS